MCEFEPENRSDVLDRCAMGSNDGQREDESSRWISSENKQGEKWTNWKK